MPYATKTSTEVSWPTSFADCALSSPFKSLQEEREAPGLAGRAFHLFPASREVLIPSVVSLGGLLAWVFSSLRFKN